MSRRLAVLALGLGVAVLTGCPPTYPKCDSDEQCKSHNEVCVSGQCQECATDANCKAGFVCQANKCVPKPECTTDQNCPAGSTCTSGKCAPKACTADGDCGPGARCKNNQCVPNTCATNDDCGTGETCQSGICAKAVARRRHLRLDADPLRLQRELARQPGPHPAQHARRLHQEGLVEEDHPRRATPTSAAPRSTTSTSRTPRGEREEVPGRPRRRAQSLDTVGYGENRPAVPARTTPRRRGRRTAGWSSLTR